MLISATDGCKDGQTELQQQILCLYFCKQYCMVKTCSLLCFNGEVFITLTFNRTSHHIDSVDFGIVFFQLQQTMVTNCHESLLLSSKHKCKTSASAGLQDANPTIRP